MSERATPETDNDTQFELAAWELLKESRQELADYRASAERARDAITQAFLRVAKERDESRELARELRDALKGLADNGHTEICSALNYANKQCDCGVDSARMLVAKSKEVLP